MTAKENARLPAGEVRSCTCHSTSTAPIRQRVQLSREFACTLEATLDPLRINVYWHGKGDPAQLSEMDRARFQSGRDSFMERLALACGVPCTLIDPTIGYVRVFGLASCEPRGRA